MIVRTGRRTPARAAAVALAAALAAPTTLTAAAAPVSTSTGTPTVTAAASAPKVVFPSRTKTRTVAGYPVSVCPTLPTRLLPGYTKAGRTFTVPRTRTVKFWVRGTTLRKKTVRKGSLVCRWTATKTPVPTGDGTTGGGGTTGGTGGSTEVLPLIMPDKITLVSISVRQATPEDVAKHPGHPPVGVPYLDFVWKIEGGQYQDLCAVLKAGEPCKTVQVRGGVHYHRSGGIFCGTFTPCKDLPREIPESCNVSLWMHVQPLGADPAGPSTPIPTPREYAGRTYSPCAYPYP